MSAPVSPAAPHVPVLLDEVIEALDPQPGEMMVDATFGAGGYSRALLARGARVHAFDRDPDAIAEGAPLATENEGRLTLHPHAFSRLAEVIEEHGIDEIRGVVFDLGVSSMQLDRAERGFAFSSDGPLDMRMAREGESAADFLNAAPESAIADVLYTYGEERRSHRVARPSSRRGRWRPRATLHARSAARWACPRARRRIPPRAVSRRSAFM